MKQWNDRQLGMQRDISRRDFINGAIAGAVGASIPGEALWASESASYPPLRSGLRGSHVGSFEVAHALTWAGQRDWGPVEDAKDEVYDLVIVGAGLSGLSAAHFFRKKHPSARILILDNHDDFGGHAKRNEFELNGETIIGYGGSQAIEDPSWYPDSGKQLFRDLGLDVQRFHKYYDHDFYFRNELYGATWFDGRVYGENAVAPLSLLAGSNFMPIEDSPIPIEEAIAQMPIGDNAKRQLTELMGSDKDLLDGMPAEERYGYLDSISYGDFLKKHGAVDDPEVFDLLSTLTADSCSSLETASAGSCIGYVGMPGYRGTIIADADESDPYIFHFPDGNAGIARMIVRKYIPDVADGNTMEDVVRARFDYSKLDQEDADFRIRLNCTVVDIAHDGKIDGPDIGVTYVEAGKARRVFGKNCVFAGYNAILPHVCPSLPEEQRAALSRAIKSPIMYTTVLLNNWHAVKEAGIGYWNAPHGYYGVAMIDFPVSMGGYEYARTPDDPILVHMERFFIGDDPLASIDEQRINGRREMYATSFDKIERETRLQLAGTFGDAGFDPAKDISAITANRWGHGYARGVWFADQPDEKGRYFNEVGRQAYGRLTIANSDAGASASANAAIREAFRAVNELG